METVLCDSAGMMQQRGEGRRTLVGGMKGKSLCMMGISDVTVNVKQLQMTENQCEEVF